MPPSPPSLLRTHGLWLAAFFVISSALIAGPVEAGPPVIRGIRLERSEVWMEEDYERFPDFLLNAMNFIHVTTSEDFLRRELTFAVGDTLSTDDIAESERRLRALGFLRDVQIEYDGTQADSVDVVVRTRETWTTSLGIRFETFQGDLLFGVSLTERNFLGRGRRLGLRWDTTPDRSGFTIDYYHPQLLGTRNELSLLAQNNTDGHRYFVEAARPWTSLDANWSYRVNFLNSGDRPRYSLDRTHFVRARLDNDELNLRLEWNLARSEEKVLRAGPMLAYEKLRFRPEPDLVVQTTFEETAASVDFPEEVGENRERLVLGVATELRSKHYEVRRFIELMGRDEDFPIGHDLQLDLGWNARALAGDVSGLHLQMFHTWNRGVGPLLHRVHTSGLGMLEHGRGRNLQLVAGYNLDSALGGAWTAAFGLKGGWGRDLDAHRPFVMGSESGLRSAGFQEFTGDRYLRSNLEIRWTHREAVWDWIVPGAAVFADFGSIYYDRDESFRWDEVHGAVGIGLRIGTAIATVGLPVRLDLAWAVARRTGTSSPVFSVGTGQAF